MSNSLKNQLDRIKQKLETLKELDKNLRLFGADAHEYVLNKPLSKNEIETFEAKYTIRLPEEFAVFYTEIGNGGVGPFYGLTSLENTVFAYGNTNLLLNPSKPFPYTKNWNMEFIPTINFKENEDEYDKQRKKFDEIYYALEFMNGTLCICNYGCGVLINLVVNGNEYGYLWTDDRSNGNGIYPSFELGNKEKIKFLDWYELWLDNSLSEIQAKNFK